MNKFRASYSILNCWDSGDWTRAIKMYFKIDTFKTEKMYLGQELHKEWESEIIKGKRLPSVFGGYKLKNPKTELKIVTDLNNWLELVGVIDLLDEPEIHDFKSGKTSSETYINGNQLGVYGILASSQGYKVNKGTIHHYDQYIKKTDVSSVWLTEKYLNNVKEWIESLSSEMHNYFITNDLYNKLGGLKNEKK